MRAIARSAGFIFKARSAIVLPSMAGPIEQKPELQLYFNRADLSKEELAAAWNEWGGEFPGIRPGEMPIHRLSAFDTDSIEDMDDRKAAEDALARRARTSPLLFVYETPKVSSPFPGYEQMDVATLVTVIAATGTLEEAREYELENQARTEVLEALDQLEDAEEPAVKPKPKPKARGKNAADDETETETETAPSELDA